MNLIEQINQKLITFSRVELLTAMGYHNLKKSQERLQKLLDAKDIYEWLDNTYYDLRHTNRTFIKNLCDVLEVPENDCTIVLDKYDERKHKLEKMRLAYIAAHTEFKRKNEPIIALCMLDSKRKIAIDNKILLDKTVKEIDALVSKRIQKHYNDCNGELMLWGKIESYTFHDSYGGSTDYDTEGNIIKGFKIPLEPIAELKIGNKIICKRGA